MSSDADISEAIRDACRRNFLRFAHESAMHDIARAKKLAEKKTLVSAGVAVGERAFEETSK